jgi:hypothetical protein
VVCGVESDEQLARVDLRDVVAAHAREEEGGRAAG